MPSGLSEVTQVVGADASKYISEYRAALAVTKELNAAHKELQQAIAAGQGVSGGAAAAADIAKMNAEIRAGLTLAREYQPAMAAASGATAGFGAAHAAAAAQVAATSSAVRGMTGDVGDMAAKFEAARVAVGAMAADALRQNEQMATSFDRVRVSSDGSGESVLSYYRNLGLVEDQARRTTAALADNADAILTARAAASGGAAPGNYAPDAATAAIIARNIAQRGATSSNTGSAAVDAALGALLGGAAGGGGGGGGGGGFLGGLTGAGTAGAHWGAVASTIATWYPRIHYALMATNELLATVGPAVIAAGAGVAVGLQGGQQLYNRAQAINAVGQSLGPSLGQTPGSFAGLGQGLQHAQNLYGAGVYEMYGAVANSLKAGAGGGFDQMGENVVAMVDRATAGITLDFKQGLGTKLQGIASQGVSDLAQFGDVAGNIGKTFVNVAANLPGVGGDILTTLQGATGGLAKATGFLGPTLGPLLAFEAASRYGPTLVGGAGALLRNTGIGVAGLGNDIAAGSGEGFLSDALMGGGMGLVGAGGFLGGLGALPIGAAGALAYLIGKSATYKTPYQQSDAAILSAVGQQGPVAGIPAIISGMNQMAGVGYSRPAPNWQLGSLGGSLVGQAVEGKPVISDAMSYEAGQIRSTLASKMSGFGDVEKHWQGILSVGHDVMSMLGLAAPPPTPYQAAQKTLQSLSDTMVNALGTGRQVQGEWDGLTHSTISMASANNVATMAALQLGSAYEKNGKLTATAKQQIANLYAGYAPMTMNTGQFGAATGAVTAMQGLAGTQLSTVNSALDQLVQITSGGAAGTASYASLLKAMPAGSAKALGSGFTSPASAAAWTAFASTTQPSVVSQLQQQTDWLRTAQTLGALGPGQTTGMAGYLLGQALPSAKDSAAGLADLSAVAQQYGGPSVAPGESAAASYKSLSAWAKQFGDTTKQYNAAMTTGTQKLSNIPSDSNQFVQTVQSQLVGGLAAGVASYGSQLQDTFMAAIGKGVTGGPAASQYLAFLKKSGVPEAGAADMASYAGQISGASGKQLAALKEQVDLVYKAGAPPAFKPVTETFTPPPAPKGGTIEYASRAHPPTAPPAPHGGTVNYGSHVQTPVAPPAPAGGTVVYHSVVIGPGGAGAGAASLGGVRLLGQHGFKVPGTGSGDTVHAMLEPGELVVPRHMVAAGAVDHLRGSIPGFQSGGIIDVPSYAGGAGIRAALEDVAQQLISFMQSAIGSATPGGGGGGYGFGYGTGALTGGPPPKAGAIQPPVPVHIASVAPPAVAALGGSSQFPGAAGPMPAKAMKVIDAFEQTFKNMPGPWAGLASQILTGLLDGVKNSTKETAAMAQALVNKVTTEINFGRSVTNTAVAGLNFPGMQVATPTMTAGGKPYQYYIDQQNIAAGGQPGSVQEQMGSYLQAMQSFQGDMSKLAKGGLQKRLLSQLYAAGPIQGDAEAQSILGGQGGIKAANQLYNQINSLATKLGVSAIGNVYGQPAAAALHGKNVKIPVHADTAAAQAAINNIHGKSVTIQVKVDISGGGSGGGGSSGITLSKQQVNAITSQVQSKLLQQAKTNRRTGLTLPGYGS